ncbi:glycosyl transferase group 1 [Solidesulfovibrio fructosivorans JJ]]|uniref:Glycosyl transferase group 1 n=1 Tax=Solidesulfovibrio fructosivorans JJ] TaxID=596151 RepID=E1K1M4_SOLFR|nr:glycosyltransferase [Solidesulfovibrio fructosivorans]EFL49462.1 glycosyl transferase group 1 [Solidesulfovibrio fructosivorans JJ]]
MHFRKALLISHITDLAGPSEALENYLRERSDVLGVIYHPFHYCSDRRSIARKYVSGKLATERKRCGLALPNLLTYFKDALFSLVFFFSLGGRYNDCVACDPLNAVVAILLKKCRLIDRVVFYTIDWMPGRFANPVLNAVYHALDRFCVKNCDAAWNISPRIVDVRREQGLPDARNVLVPVGVDLEKIDLPDKSDRAPRDLVLLGALAPSKGVDLVIEAWPRLLARYPDLRLHVIGKTPNDAVEDGVVYAPYEPRLDALGDSVILHGVMNHDKVLETLPACDISLALYRPTDNNLSRWADPSRVKDYLACGVPVIITDVPEIAKDVAAERAGIVAEYTSEAVEAAVAAMVEDPAKWRAMRQAAVTYMQRYRWSAIFDASFEAARG